MKLQNWSGQLTEIIKSLMFVYSKQPKKKGRCFRLWDKLGDSALGKTNTSNLERGSPRKKTTINALFVAGGRHNVTF